MKEINAKATWFKMFPAQFLSDRLVRDMSTLELGATMRLIFYQFIDGDLPNDKNRLCKMSGMEPKDFDAYWNVCQQFFGEVDGDIRYNAWLANERNITVTLMNERSENGKKAAEKRWSDPEVKKKSKVKLTHLKDEQVVLAFNFVWKFWPPRSDGNPSKGDRLKGEKVFQQIIDDGIATPFQLTRVAEYYWQNYPYAQKGFIRQIATFFSLDAGLWAEIFEIITQSNIQPHTELEIRTILEAEGIKSKIKKDFGFEQPSAF